MESKSWKTATGSITLALGGALLAGSQVAEGELKVWLQLIGTILVTFGTGLMGYGVANRVSTTSVKTEKAIETASIKSEKSFAEAAAVCAEDKQKGFIKLPLLVSIFALLLFFGCTMDGLKPVSQMTPKEKLAWMLSFYNAQDANYKALASTPTLTDGQKEILRKKKAVMVEVYPLIELYSSYVMAGAAPTAALEENIINYLDRLGALVAQ